MTARRRSLPLNTTRQLWAQCGGFCQNPTCTKPLFRSFDDEVVSLANVAHIIGHGSNGPRSDHELAEYIDRDGIDNLLMLCLECHWIVDELEKRFPVETMAAWKKNHANKIETLFSIPQIRDENLLLTQVSDLLDENAAIFREYGPFSDNLLKGEGGDGRNIWRRRCLDTILPNNNRIIQLIEKNKYNFPRPWDAHSYMLEYKMHADAFQDNCLTDCRVNDYKTFPREFSNFIKTKLGIPSVAPEVIADEELEYRHNKIQIYVDKYLSDHSNIRSLQELNHGTMLVELIDGRSMKVFVTNTYFFTEYSLERVLEIDPAVDAIICSSPVIEYSKSAKIMCIERGIGLFMLREFMGAIRYEGERFLNFLHSTERHARVKSLKEVVGRSSPPDRSRVFVLGSFLRSKVYRDVDLFIVYEDPRQHASYHPI
ncbi:nucleotidyltransferase domain-containing protein [Burkholderia cepacia]|uniref:nucleotidyltransferase domain-containing protein n=1 Tax=Burkholderia cepacia TaxID=292 RepID=UPI001F42CC8C|nr:nucleotidyltransferase domain-containing protein [Burkholderia cepacia]MCE4124443.1 nucleotidyltransferase domain-containing protein [Burkholderia cepacia]